MRDHHPHYVKREQVKRKLKRDIGIGLAITALLWGLGEIGLRLYVGVFRGPLLQVYKVADPDLGWILKPGFSSQRLNINSLGYRGEEFKKEKQKGTVRIVMFGDSCVFGSFLRDSETLPRKLESGLQERGVAAQVINAGVPGYGSGHVLAKLQHDIVDLDPDVVILSAGWNDFFYFYPGDPQYRRPADDTFNRCLEHSYVLKLMVKIVYQKIRPLLESGDSLPLYQNYVPVQFIRNYRTIVDFLYQQDSLVVCLTLPSALGDDHVDAYRDRLAYPFFTTDTTCMRALWEVYNAHIRKIAGEDVFDLARVIRAREREGELFVDTHHFNPEGAQVAAQLLCDHLVRSGKFVARGEAKTAVLR